MVLVSVIIMIMRLEMKRYYKRLWNGRPFQTVAIIVIIIDHSNTLDLALKNLLGLQTQGALILLRSCYGAPKLTNLLRSAPCWGHPILETIDTQTRQDLESILNITLYDTQWVRATLPIRDGGLRVRRVTMLVFCLLGF